MGENVVTRIAPSPTGFLHVGTARTALFNFLFTQKNNGTFLLRFEDTDRERSKKEYERDILEGLSWLGIKHDGEIMRQSQRTEIYKKYLGLLIENKHAYEAEESEKGSGPVIRFKNPNTTVAFTDGIRGEVTFNTSELGDFVIARSMTEPLYHLAVVVDDAESGVTHVIRGEDHISNTPRHILIIEALGFTQPTYAHLPLILAPDKSKMSKRHGAVSVHEYKKMGVLSEALVNYLALLGWHPRDTREIFSMDELIKVFDLSRVQKSGAVFDMTKLRSINKKYLDNLTQEDFLVDIKKHLSGRVLDLVEGNKERSEKLLPALRERLEIFSDISTMADAGELDYFFKSPEYTTDALRWKSDSSDTTRMHLSRIEVMLRSLPEKSFTKEIIQETLWTYAHEHGKGSVLWPMRYALSGKEKSPDPFQLVEIFGKQETLTRINHAIKRLS